MSRATIISGSAFFLSTAATILFFFSGAFAHVGPILIVWVGSIPAVLVTVALDIRHKRYWGIAVLVPTCIVVGLVILLVYALSHATLEIG